jgi:NAD(P)-dependent dehydrogenase (short-subunit alcohol dehydrogenase family)
MHLLLKKMHLLQVTSSRTLLVTMNASDRRIILITGGNKGIGFETARQLGQQGHHVLLAARDGARAEAAAARLRGEGLAVDPITLDVTDGASIERAAAWIEERHGRLDSLINNAGIALEPWGAGTSGVPLDLWRKIFETNLFGQVAVTGAMLPLLRRSAAGRIVNLSSIMGSLALHADPSSPIYHFKSVAYDSSKAALNQYTIHLAYELRETSIKVNAAHPGWVKTELGGDAAPMELVDGARTSVYLATLPADGPTGAFIHMQDRLPW